LPQQYSTKPVNNFIKGLITEASVMTFPDGASSDELNCDLLKNGARQRRRGIEFESGYQTSTFNAPVGSFIHTQTWQNVSGLGGAEYLVVQVDSTVYFYDKSFSTLSAGLKSFSINLNDYSAGNNVDVNTSAIGVSSSIGYLVIVSAAIDPIRVIYNKDDDTISVSKIKIEVRDFEYLNMSSDISSIQRSSNTVTVNTSSDHALSIGNTVRIDCKLSQFNGDFTVATVPSTTSFTYTQAGTNISSTSVEGTATRLLGNDAIPTIITRNYQYDLYNQGWGERVRLENEAAKSTPYASYQTISGFFGYPPRNKPWYVGKVLDQTDIKFKSSLFYSSATGNTLAPNGFFILDFFVQDRSAATNETPAPISGLKTVIEPARFTCTTAFAGRVWYAGLNSAKNGGKIFYSKVIESKDDFGKCYQMASPTAEDTAGVVDSDGGYIIIPDVSDIQALFPAGPILFVLASNGIWAIGGVDQVFKATEYYVSKISNFGIVNSRTLSNVSGTPVYWGTSGIYAIGVEGNTPSVTSISENIKTFYDNIANDAKKAATSVFDRLNDRIYWIYPDADESIDNKKNKVLVLDMTLKAFFPWEVSDKDSNTPYIVDAVYLSGLGSEEVVGNVIDNAENLVFQEASFTNQVVANLTQSSSEATEIKFLVSTVVGGNRKLTFATFSNRDFLDWDTEDYSSYAETGYDFFGSATLKKNTPYITTYMKRTEENFVASGSGYETDYPSGCVLTVKWDLSGDNSRWSSPNQLYRLSHSVIVNPSNLTFSYPYDTIVCRTKVRGKGRVLRMRFESEEGKDFYLIGWEMIGATNSRY
jgi:hypothetical protein